jgi:23S rRNA pseudouridine1911/1915/1917 synthase
VNRLDKPVSGVVLFAKKASSMHDLSMLGSVGGMRKIYLAIVDKIPSTVGLIENHFTHNRKLNKSFAGSEKTADSKKGRTDLEVIASSDRYHLIKVEILSGRHHQIRAQMEALESHIKGDVKYGARRGNKDRSICLHSWKIIFKHPGDNSTVSIAAPLPEDALWKVFAAPIEALNNRINEESESGD